MATKATVDVEVLRAEIQSKYAEVANDPTREFHFHTGRKLAQMLGYPEEIVDALPDRVVESFAGVGNPFSVGSVEAGERVVDVGSGSGFDSIIAARYAGDGGRVIGIDMTQEMLDKADESRALVGLDNVEFRQGFAESLPVEDAWADVVQSNGVANLCPDKGRVFAEMFRVLRPGGRLNLADIVTHKPVPQEAREDVDLWTA